MGERTENVQDGNLGETLEQLIRIIEQRRSVSPEESYTARLLSGDADKLHKKIVEEATEVILASKDEDHDHIRYEAADLLYHLFVLLERKGISIEELAGELNARMA
jgi:phosphoribosyl-ATP pyrophosphohydrolase